MLDDDFRIPTLKFQTSLNVEEECVTVRWSIPGSRILKLLTKPLTKHLTKPLTKPLIEPPTKPLTKPLTNHKASNKAIYKAFDYGMGDLVHFV